MLFDNLLLSRISVPILPSFLTEEKIEKEFLSTAIGIILNRDSQTKVVSSSETSDWTEPGQAENKTNKTGSGPAKLFKVVTRPRLNQVRNSSDRLVAASPQAGGLWILDSDSKTTCSAWHKLFCFISYFTSWLHNSFYLWNCRFRKRSNVMEYISDAYHVTHISD